MERSDQEKRIFVAPYGRDDSPGTEDRPFATWVRAQAEVRRVKKDNMGKPITVMLREGTYYLKEPLTFRPEDSGSSSAPIQYRSYPGEKVVISGGCHIGSRWHPYKDGIWVAELPQWQGRLEQIDGLFIDGSRQVRARYPNVDADQPLMDGPGYLQAAGGTNLRPDRELAFDPATFTDKSWDNPTTGIIHAFQSHYWGNMQYRLADVDRENHVLHLGEGGFQLQRSHGISHRSRYYIDNIFEELDAPGVWYWDGDQGKLYCFPHEGIDLNQSLVVTTFLKQLITFCGSPALPVSGIKLSGLQFAHTGTTFMEPYEDLARGDWAIHRGGAVYFEGAEDCGLEDCFFDAVGGNAVFISGYNRRISVEGCSFEAAGESAVCVVGRPESVRMYQTWEMMEGGQRPAYDDLPGPRTPDYPADCIIGNNIIRNIGIYGKQTAGVFISMSRRITVSRNSIYEVPRAAICINDGTWGGHRIEFNDIWETVRETGEHGPFNSWGRERQWGDQAQTDRDGGIEMNKAAVFLDALEPNVICYNRIRNMRKSVSAGNWTIDLDDGSSYYHIYGNLCLGSTLKLRDGYYRRVENNIFISPIPLGWHVWPKDSGDVFVRNIVVVAGCRPGEAEPTEEIFGPVRMPEHPWGQETDWNLYWNANTQQFLVKERAPGRSYNWEEWLALGYDTHSRVANPLFVDAERGDFRLQPDSTALDIGFVPLPLDQIGHTQTRIVPPGETFAGAVDISILPDERGGEVWYTLDGSRPEAGGTTSCLCRGRLQLTQTTTVRAITVCDGLVRGYERIAEFTRADSVSHPSWLKALIRNEAMMLASSSPETTAASLRFMGAAYTDISDGDLVDALGGHDEGVLFTDVPDDSDAYRAGLRSSDVLVRWNEEPIRATEDLIMQRKVNGGQPVRIQILRGYQMLNLLIAAHRVAIPKG
ncbi:chitobiase/beta-hexosaminidase C-terminal domain-containing protein [Paenibacillus sp. strain BS8-2]